MQRVVLGVFISVVALFCFAFSVDAQTAPSGLGKRGESCPYTVGKPKELLDAYKGINPKIEVQSATCQTYKDCEDGAPKVRLGTSELKKGYIHQKANSGCVVLGQHQFGEFDTDLGCCIYISEPPPPIPPPNPGSGGDYENPLGTFSIFEIIRRVIRFFLGIVGGFAFLVFVYSGITWMTAGADTARMQKAQAAMKYAIIGMMIIGFSYPLTLFVIRMLTGS